MEIAVRKHPMLTAMFAAMAVIAVPAHASLIINVQSVTVAPGSVNDTLDVSLTNTGPASSQIGGFSFDISTANPGVIFDSAIYSTGNPYIFAGFSFDQDFGFPLATATGTSLEASDLYDGAGAATVASGSTVGLGRVVFHVAAGTANGPIPVTLAAFPATSLSDAAGGNLTFTGNGGTITVASASSVPEPATFGMLGGALALFGFIRRKRSI